MEEMELININLPVSIIENLIQEQEEKRRQLIKDFQKKLAESDNIISNLHEAMRKKKDANPVLMNLNNIISPIYFSKKKYDINWKVTDKVKFILIEVGTVMSAREIVKYIVNNYEKGFMEEVGTKVHVALNTFSSNGTLKIYSNERPYRYGLPEWFEGNKLKEEYEIKFKALQQVP